MYATTCVCVYCYAHKYVRMCFVSKCAYGVYVHCMYVYIYALCAMCVICYMYCMLVYVYIFMCACVICMYVLCVYVDYMFVYGILIEYGFWYITA